MRRYAGNVGLAIHLHKGRITNWFTADSGTEIQHIDPAHRPSDKV